MYKETIVNVQTGEITYRDYTPEEIAVLEATKAKLEAEDAEIIKKAEIRKSALNKLIDLGLTEDEIAAL